MADLSARKCKPCEGGVAPLTRDEARELLARLDEGWTLNDAATLIEREFDFPAFARTIAFVNAVAFIATNEGHHPFVHFGYGNCRVAYTTTAIDGLSENDFICAAKIDQLLS
jgi:4a-hydroxytetrahydrobiopterin dehydratase